jgi:hypothetical protein
MRLMSIRMQTLDALRLCEHLAPLFRQGGEPTSERVLSGPADLEVSD